MSTATSAPALSVLDLVPVRAGQTSAQAVAASLSLAQTADRLGFRRYWFAEHHNMPAVASTTPPVLVAAAAARTSRIRVGSGGVMLPNHSPLVVAEQFAALEALAPGRIDLGIGRAPGSRPGDHAAAAQSGTTSDVERFPDHIRDILSLVSPEGASVRFSSGGTYDVHATPGRDRCARRCGCSDRATTPAQLAAALGLPYVFANHFSGQGLERALDLYRTGFQADARRTPSRAPSSPSNAIAAPTAEEAEARSLPNQRMMARLRTNMPLTAARDGRAGASPAPTTSTDSRSRSWRRRARTGSSARARR